MSSHSDSPELIYSNENARFIEDYMFAGFNTQVYNVNVNKNDASSSKLDAPAPSAPPIRTRQVSCKSNLCNEPEKQLQELDDALYIHFEENCCLEIKGSHGSVKSKGSTKSVRADPISDPCLCACDCRIGIIKKTTYCSTCKGYKTPGEDLVKMPPYNSTHPCPLFYKVIEYKNSNSSWGSGQDRSKLSGQSRSKNSNVKVKTVSPSRSHSGTYKKSSQHSSGAGASGDTSPDRADKKSKKTIDPRFVFIYGVTGIPAKIGHTRCLVNCDGSCTHENEVSKHMGWNWRAKNVLGMKYAKGWRPGAIPKHILRLLKRARQKTDTTERKAKLKRKQSEQKPTLVVKKTNGIMQLELQNKEDKAKPYTFETSGKGDDVTPKSLVLDNSSSDLDWEIHYSPPITRNEAKNEIKAVREPNKTTSNMWMKGNMNLKNR